MGVNKFEATGLPVQIHQSMVGQGVNGAAMGFSTPEPSATPTISPPKIEIAGPGGMGGR